MYSILISRIVTRWSELRVSKYSTNRRSRSIRLEENRKSVWFITIFEWKEIETWLFFFANPRLRLIFVHYTGSLWICFCITNTLSKNVKFNFISSRIFKIFKSTFMCHNFRPNGRYFEIYNNCDPVDIYFHPTSYNIRELSELVLKFCVHFTNGSEDPFQESKAC